MSHLPNSETPVVVTGDAVQNARNGHTKPKHKRTKTPATRKANVGKAPPEVIRTIAPTTVGLPISAILQQMPHGESPLVEHLDKLVESIIEKDDLDSRSNLSPALVAHLIRARVFAHYARAKGYTQTADAMDGFVTYVLTIRRSVKGWGMERLISALQAVRIPFMGEEPQGGRLGAIRDRVMGRRG